MAPKFFKYSSANQYYTAKTHLICEPIYIVNCILPNRTDDKSINKITSALRSLQQEIEAKYPDFTLYLNSDIILGAAVGEATQDIVA